MFLKIDYFFSLQGPCEWSSTKGQKVTLTTSTLLSLSDIERVSLQKVALTKLQALNLGCAITIPKGGLIYEMNIILILL